MEINEVQFRTENDDFICVKKDEENFILVVSNKDNYKSKISLSMNEADLMMIATCITDMVKG